MAVMIEIDGERYLEADEAAQRLGVKPETLYAYVSRRRLRSFRRAVGRGRLYLERDIDRLLSLLPNRIRGDAAPSPEVEAGRAEAPVPDETPLPQADAWAAER